VKSGTENRKKLIAAVVLTLAAVLLVARMVLVDSGPSASAPPPYSTANSSTSSTRTTPRRLSSSRNRPLISQTLDPRLRLDLLKSAEDTRYAGTGRNIFLQHEDAPIPQVVKTPVVQTPVQTQTLPPAPPPIDLKFFGFASKMGESKRVFLSKGGDVFLAAEGDIVDRRYKVLRIGPSVIEIQDVLNNRRQSIPMTQG
jgi:hypothetical protein